MSSSTFSAATTWQNSLRQNVPGLRQAFVGKVHEPTGDLKNRKLSVVEDDQGHPKQKRRKKHSEDLDTRPIQTCVAPSTRRSVAEPKTVKFKSRSSTNLRSSVTVPRPVRLELKVLPVPPETIVSPIPLPRGVVCIDPTEDNSMVDCWPDFVAYLREREASWIFESRVIIGQSHSLEANRFILMNWILEVIYHFRLSQESLYLCVSLIDAVFALREVDMPHYQLVAITTMLIASKMEEYHPPDIKQLIGLTENSYTFEEVVQMEIQLLDLLHFDLSIPSPMIFLNRYIRASLSHEHPLFREACLYFYDCLIPCVEYSSYAISKKAAAAVYAARQLFQVSEDPVYLRWTPTLEYYAKYKEADICELAMRMIDVLLKLQRDKKKHKREEGVMKKFKSQSRHKGVILTPEMSLERVEKVVTILNIITSQEL